MIELTDKMRRWLRKNGSQKVRVTWSNGFVDSYTYDAKMITSWDDIPNGFNVTHVERAS